MNFYSTHHLTLPSTTQIQKWISLFSAPKALCNGVGGDGVAHKKLYTLFKCLFPLHCSAIARKRMTFWIRNWNGRNERICISLRKGGKLSELKSALLKVSMAARPRRLSLTNGSKSAGECCRWKVFLYQNLLSKIVWNSYVFELKWIEITG